MKHQEPKYLAQTVLTKWVFCVFHFGDCRRAQSESALLGAERFPRARFKLCSDQPRVSSVLLHNHTAINVSSSSFRFLCHRAHTYSQPSEHTPILPAAGSFTPRPRSNSRTTHNAQRSTKKTKREEKKDEKDGEEWSYTDREELGVRALFDNLALAEDHDLVGGLWKHHTPSPSVLASSS